jgi:hypothetical protein
MRSLSGITKSGGIVCPEPQIPQLFYFNPPSAAGFAPIQLLIYALNSTTKITAVIDMPDSAVNTTYFGFKYSPTGSTYVAKISAINPYARYYFPGDAIFIIP